MLNYRNLQPLIWLGLISSATLILGGCTLKSPTSDDVAKPVANQEISDVNEAKPATSSNQLSANIEEKKGPMVKTIKDFTPIEGKKVTIKTTQGEFIIDLYRDQAPLTTLNFLTLVKDKFYDDIVFHRVIPGFMAQVGDPLTKDASKQALWGSGGPGYTIPDEFGKDLKHDKKGIVSMANAGANTGGSQIFITYDATPWLDGKHAVFGYVSQGMDVVDKITQGDKIISATINQ